MSAPPVCHLQTILLQHLPCLEHRLQDLCSYTLLQIPTNDVNVVLQKPLLIQRGFHLPGVLLRMPRGRYIPPVQRFHAAFDQCLSRFQFAMHLYAEVRWDQYPNAQPAYPSYFPPQTQIGLHRNRGRLLPGGYWCTWRSNPLVRAGSRMDPKNGS